ncbi:MAG: DUF6067 family protein [Agriterribacter sp.]
MRLILSLLFFCSLAEAQQHNPTPGPSEYLPVVCSYRSATSAWEDHLGNHRALIKILSATDAALVNIPWRLQKDISANGLIITDTAGRQIKNIFRISTSRENISFVFQPSSGAGIYYVYYMPWEGKKNMGNFDGKYIPREAPAEAGWINAHHLTAPMQKNVLSALKGAEIITLESRTAFDSFYPMEVIATKKETEKLTAKANRSMLLFPENRQYPVKMKNDLPYRWIQKGLKSMLKDEVFRNEYYAFQIGLFAGNSDLKNIKVSCNNTAFTTTCFNLEGTDARGNYFTKRLDVKKQTIQPLWLGTDIPENTKPGVYTLSVHVSADHIPEQIIIVMLTVKDSILQDRGDNQLWRHSRLRWLNSTAGISDENIAPNSPLQIKDATIIAGTGQIKLSSFGLPESIIANNKELLAQPVSFIVETIKGIERLTSSPIQFTKNATGKSSWICKATNDALTIVCNGSMESDGYIHYQLKVISLKEMEIKDIRLDLPVKKEMASAFMGMGLPGTECPVQYAWKWKGATDAYWIGNADAGLYCELKGASYTGPMLNLYHPDPPASWYNKNAGGFTITTINNTTVASTYSGSRRLTSKDSLVFDFALLITPVKKINTTGQFINRYYHDGTNPIPQDKDLSTGIKVINIHHANRINPYINYPFTTADLIKQTTQEWHAKGEKIKIYYTVRELTSLTTELWALRSLGNEIFADGNGGGYLWLKEHLIDHYNPQWYTPPVGSLAQDDAALLTSGESRWYNYYIEGLKWLVKNTDIDGLYLDDVAYDREMLKRMCRVMNEVKPGCMIDLHSHRDFSNGPATQYTEFFPYLDKLWFGESFQYNKMSAANWLVEVSGIPFGLMGDMLQDGGNPWRGMVYGMTSRYPWRTEGVTCEPQNIWKLWDSFGIADAQMVGYWDSASFVKTSNDSVLATAYKKNNKLLISVASWAKDTVVVKLTIDWQKVGWKPKKVLYTASAIKDFQPLKQWEENEEITVAPAKGWLLEVE